MNYLLAKTRGRHTDLKKVLSTMVDVFDIPNLSDILDYSSDYKLEENEWYKLEGFSALGYENSIIDTKWNSTDYNQIMREEYSKIAYLCCKQRNHFLFQKMSSTQLLSKKWFSISGEPAIEVERPIVVLNDFVDAVYDIKSDILYFQNIARIKSIFKGIEELYREATQKEVDSFLNQDFITLANGYTCDSVKTANRKRIAQAIDSLNKLEPKDKPKIFTYIKNYCDDVAVNNNSFVVETEENLRKVLYGIEQRYYTTPFGNEKRLANSILKL